MSDPDAIVVGSGPNGLAAAVALAQEGAQVLVLEAKARPGGGLRTEEVTLPGFRHDLCSGVHPMGILSPYFRTLPLEEHGLRWRFPEASVAHPFDGGPAVLLTRSLGDTMGELGVDGLMYRRLVGPFLKRPHALLGDALGPLGIPKNPVLLARFGMRALWGATTLGRLFRGERAKALLAGCAAHSILPLSWSFSAAVGLMFLITAHVETWPVAEGGSEAIARALASLLKSLGGRIECGVHVRSLAELPPARVVLFDTSPAQLAHIAEPALPPRYVRGLRRYLYGPGAFKVDWALDGPIPWKDPRCRGASTVHVGGTMRELAAAEAAVWRGEHPERPFVLLCQQSEADPTRAPEGQHTGYAYVHVPNGSTVDPRPRGHPRGPDRPLRAGLSRPGARPLRTWNTGRPPARTTRATSAARSPAASPTVTQLFTPPRGSPRSVLDPEPADLWICSGGHPTRRRRARHGRLASRRRAPSGSCIGRRRDSRPGPPPSPPPFPDPSGGPC
jgi:phytoene dehydrogenase-like protein